VSKGPGLAAVGSMSTSEQTTLHGLWHILNCAFILSNNIYSYPCAAKIRPIAWVCLSVCGRQKWNVWCQWQLS